MNDTPAETSPEENPSPVEISALDNIVDDSQEIEQCRKWILAEFFKGRDADSILEELLATGWEADEVERLVEEGRRETRHLRGVVAPEEVRRVAERRYRSSFRMAFFYALGGVPLMCFHALWSMLVSKKNQWPNRYMLRSQALNEQDEAIGNTSQSEISHD